MKRRIFRSLFVMFVLYFVYGETGFVTTLFLFVVWTDLEMHGWGIDAIFEELTKVKR